MPSLRTCNVRRRRKEFIVSGQQAKVDALVQRAVFNALDKVVGGAINRFYDRVIPEMLAYQKFARTPLGELIGIQGPSHPHP